MPEDQRRLVGRFECSGSKKSQLGDDRCCRQRPFTALRRTSVISLEGTFDPRLRQTGPGRQPAQTSVSSQTVQQRRV